MSGAWIKVYEAGNNLEAHSIKGMLENEQIEVQLSGENLSAAAGELPTDVLQVGIWVREELVAAARRQLRRYEQGRLEDWICPDCNERNGGLFEICWQCGRAKH